MKIIAQPAFGWEGKQFTCPACTAVIEFEVADRRTPSMKFNKPGGGAWRVSNVRCPVCGAFGTFREVPIPPGTRSAQGNAVVTISGDAKARVTPA